MPTFGFKPEPNLRTNGGYIHFKYYNIQFHNSFFPHFSRLWNTFPESAKSKDILEFKEYLKTEIKPCKIKHFSKGNKYSNTLLTRIRVGRSELNQHKFIIGLSESPECICHHREESPLHYLIDCFQYLPAESRFLGKLANLVCRKIWRKSRKILING